jgi:serine phosphatase RsbU (regulator of sigma subunit)/anti-sigma regulatory factor (Ser/Thr protein kinase)
VTVGTTTERPSSSPNVPRLPVTSPSDPRLRFVAITAGVCAAYATGSLLAFWWFDALGVGPSFYPPAGVTLAALVLLPRRDWPAVILGVALAEGSIDLWQGLGALTPGYVLANTIEPLVGATLIRRRLGRPDLRRRHDLLVFVLLAVLITPFVGGIIGATNYTLFDEGGWARFVLHWWIGDGLGVLVVGGSILAWRTPTGRRPTSGDWITTGAFVVAAIVLIAAEARFRSLALAYLAVLLLGWTAFRLGTRGVAIVGCALSFAVATAAAQGYDPYTGLGYRPGLALAYLQMSIMLVLVGAFALASEIHEREVAIEGRSREQERRARAEATAGRDHEIALTLQRSMLGPTSVRTDRASIACYYGAGVDDLQAGGDWHDVITLPDGRLGLAVGDVLGRGLTAATAMGQLRIALAALASNTPGPSALIDRLEAFATGIGGAEMATVVYANLDPQTGSMTYACAGHPPPLVVSPLGVATFLWDGRSRPIGSSRPLPRTDGVASLEDGSMLVLYTDGLVERRGESLDLGLERLRAAAEALHGLPADEARDGLVSTLLAAGGRSDDVAVVVLRLGRAATEAFERRFTADLGSLRPLRRELSAWLDDRGVTSTVREAVVLSVWEAAVNAVEHGSARPDDPVVVRLTIEGRSLTAEIEDVGGWKQQTPDPTRGNGLPLMRGSMDDVTVTTGDRGTTVTLRRQVELIDGRP